MDWRYIPLAAIGLLVAGFGIQVHEPLRGETPVIRSFNPVRGSSVYFHFATMHCIADGKALDGYVTNVFDLLDEPPVINLGPHAELTTLSRAKRLIHDRPSKHNLDPNCLKHGYFEPRQSALIWSLLGRN